MPAVVNQQYSAFLEDVDLAWQPGEKLRNDALRFSLEMKAYVTHRPPDRLA